MNTPATSLIDILRSREIREIFSRNHIRHIYLTGSFARWDATSASDVDLIYEKQPGAKFTLMNIGDIKYSLEERLGKEVDLISENALRPEIRMRVLRDKTLVL